jgi:hypothetical protein
MPVTLAVIGGVTSAANVGMGLSDRARAKRMLSNLKDPNYIIPDAITESVGRAKNLASSTRMAGQTGLEMTQDQILANTALGIERGAGSSSEGLSALVRADANRTAAQNQIGGMAEQSYLSRNQAVNQELARKAAAQDKQFEVNVKEPFLRKLNWASGLLNNGNQLISSGVQSAASTVGGVANYNLNKDYIDTMGSQYKKWTPTTTDAELVSGDIPRTRGTSYYGSSTPEMVFGTEVQGTNPNSSSLLFNY